MTVRWKLTVLLSFVAIGCNAPLGRYPTALNNGDLRSQSQFAVARSLEQQGKLTQARPLYEQVLAADATRADAQHRLAVIAVKEGRMDEAEQMFDAAIAQTPEGEQGDLLCDLGYALYLQGRFEDAEQHFRTCVAQNPDNRRALNNLGLTLGRQGKDSEAFRMFRRVGDEASAHANLGYAYARNGDLDAAEKHYSRALDYDNSLRHAPEALMQIAQVRDTQETSGQDQMLPLGSAGAAAIARTQAPMEDTEGLAFAEKWKSNKGQGSQQPREFQFTDEVYGAAENQVVPAGHTTTPQTSGRAALNPPAAR